MAIAYLSAPGRFPRYTNSSMLTTLLPATSVDVERGFSRGGRVVSKLRHNLSEDSTRAATVLSEWVENSVFSASSDFAARLADGWKRGKNCEGVAAEQDAHASKVLRGERMRMAITEIAETEE